jgi:Gti1/Pac2 family transcription factor
MDGEGEEGPDGYRYKPDGLMKQSFSITTSQGNHLHLISYYSRSSPTAQILRQPTNDPSVNNIHPAKGMYPESTVNDQSTVPAVTRSPMPGAPNYVVAPSPAYGRPHPHPHAAYLPPGYIPHPAYMAYPLSPMATPPPYAMHYGHPGIPMGYAPYPQAPLPMNQAPPSAFDQRPLRGSESQPSRPAPYSQSAPPPPVTQSYQQPNYATSNSNYSSLPASNGVPDAERNGLQIDPRLTAPPALTPMSSAEMKQPLTPQPQSQDDESSVSPVHKTAENGVASVPMTHSNSQSAMPNHEQVPQINGLQVPDHRMNSIIPSPSARSPHPTSNANAAAVAQNSVSASSIAAINTTSAAVTPTVVTSNLPAPTGATTATSNTSEVRSPTDDEKEGSVSPGGTKKAVTIPQDIPSEKLGFREDKRALSMLDRAFARV